MRLYFAGMADRKREIILRQMREAGWRADLRHGEGGRSRRNSTKSAAMLRKAALDDRRRCRAILHRPPAGIARCDGPRRRSAPR